MTRLEKLQHQLKVEKLDGLLITNLYNLRYIANFTGTTGMAVVTQTKAYFITDARYTEQAKVQCVGFELVENTGPIYNELTHIVSSNQIKVLGYEDGNLTVQQFNRVKSVVDCELVEAGGMIEALREFKDAEEFAIIEKACNIADKAFEYILGEIKPGITELEVANKMDFYMRSLGASGVSFDTIVASGHRSAMPHGVASSKVIETGDFITLDYGCYYNGYVSDMTRTISLGQPRHKELIDIHAVVLGAQIEVSDKIRLGMTGKEVDRIARDYIAKRGYGQYFTHSTGHGIGLEIHEAPGLNRLSETVLSVGHAITNEPGIYIPGIGGVRIEDDIFMTEDGPKVITKATKELIIL
ncbi:aminopeptidase P family protein [Carnobacteriaceae bacterium zg-ZUI252]|nr:aminopeptidase P family protein [Carnobacteriaceae bacterium zg-ZUI252]MBS4770243.1 aminopeptidase P family protein [Carnobacteriaceae bacterium zg-ZUI240]